MIPDSIEYNKVETETSGDLLTTSLNHTIDSNLNANTFGILTADQAHKLKNMNKTPNFDSTFIGCLLALIHKNWNLFGVRIAERNRKMSIRIQMDKNQFIFSLTGMLLERIADDNKRTMNFNKFVNKKCNNLRRCIITSDFHRSFFYVDMI